MVSLVLVVGFRAWAQPQSQQQTQASAIGFIPYFKWLEQVKQQLIKEETTLSHQLGATRYQTEDGQIQIGSERVDVTSQVKAIQTSTLQNAQNVQNIITQWSATNVSVRIYPFHLNATVQQNLSLGSATLHLKMECQELRLKLTKPATVTTEIFLKNNEFQMNHIAWLVDTSAMDTELVGCQQMSGFDSLIKQKAEELLKIEYAQNLVQNFLNQKLNGLIQNKIQLELSKALSQIEQLADMQSTVSHAFDSAGNLWIYSNSQAVAQFNLEDIQQLQKLNQQAVLVKKIDLENTIKNSINTYLKNKTLLSGDNKNLKKLTCSRWVQTFIWPSLKSLKKCFEMRINTAIESLELNQGSQDVAVSTKALTALQGEGHLLANIKTQIDSNLATEQTFLNNFQFKIDSEFVKWSGRSKRVSQSTIQTAIEGFLNQITHEAVQTQFYKVFKTKIKLKIISEKSVLLTMLP